MLTRPITMLNLRRLIGRLARRRDADADFPNPICDGNGDIERYPKHDVSNEKANNAQTGNSPTARIPKNAKAPPPPYNRRDNGDWYNNRAWSQGSHNQSYDKETPSAPSRQGEARGEFDRQEHPKW